MSLPGAVDQIWHSDNARGGVTVIIPLVDCSLNQGPTQVIPSTVHHS